MLRKEEGLNCVLLKKRQQASRRVERADRSRHCVFEALKTTQFSVPQSEMRNRSDIWYAAASSRVSTRNICDGWPSNKMEQ